MTSLFRNAATAFALVVACVPASHAFPPCPLDRAVLVSLDAPPPPSGTHIASWSTIQTSVIGTLTPVSFQSPCPHIPNVPQDGGCNIDVFMLANLPPHASSGIVGNHASYSQTSGAGLLALPDLRNAESLNRGLGYTLGMAINTTAMAHAGDWIDLVQLEFDSEAERSPGTIYRLRKIARADGVTEIRLIRAQASTTGMVSDTIVAAIPLDGKQTAVPIALHWEPTVSVSFATPTSFLADGPPPRPVARYSVVTALRLDVGNTTRYVTTLAGQMPSIATMGLLDYNLPEAESTWGARAVAATPSRRKLAIDAIVANIGSASVPSSLDEIAEMDAPGALLTYYYSTFSVVSK